MKPLSAEPDVPSSDAQAASPAPIVEQLRAIDTSVLECLLEIGREKSAVERYRQRAEQMRAKVTDAVFRQVAEDYANRCAALEARATPLRAQARGEYRKLGQLIGQTGRAYEQARFQKEELEFRQAVGELDDEQLADRLRDPQRVLDECHADMTAIDELKARFVEALGSEQALEEPSEPATATAEAFVPPAAAAPADASPPAAAAEPAPEETVLIKAAVSVAAPAPAAAVPAASPPDVTIIAPLQAADPDATPAPEATRLISAEELAAFLVPRAALVTPEGVEPRAEYRLAQVNYIGRSEDNQIQIARPGVSRKHATITGTSKGFSIKDLGSQNSTFVNGTRITERELADGDMIEIAGMRLVFRSPWPARSGGGATKSGAPRRTLK
jgi:hypothetical protein